MSTEAMKLALEALEEPHPGIRTSFTDAITYREKVKQAITALQEALALALAQPQPVAWMSDCAVGFRKSEFGATPTVPLYTSPPARKPLTDDEIRAIVRKVDEEEGHIIHFARAIEAKHNIKGDA
jgi:hypothetical protein